MPPAPDRSGYALDGHAAVLVRLAGIGGHDIAVACDLGVEREFAGVKDFADAAAEGDGYQLLALRSLLTLNAVSTTPIARQ